MRGFRKAKAEGDCQEGTNDSEEIRAKLSVPSAGKYSTCTKRLIYPSELQVTVKKRSWRIELCWAKYFQKPSTIPGGKKSWEGWVGMCVSYRVQLSRVNMLHAPIPILSV